MKNQIKLIKILGELVKYGIVVDFCNNENCSVNVILFKSENAERLIVNLEKLGYVVMKTEVPEVINVYYNDKAVIDGIFEKYC